MNSYFSHDSNARNSDQLINVRIKHGIEGYGIYFMILERLREEHDYMSVKDYNAIAFDLHTDASKVKSVVEDFGLFDFTDDGKCFYSKGFNKRMAFKDDKVNRRKEASKKAAEARWKGKNNANAMPNDANAMQTHSERNANAMPNDAEEKESKVNQSKEKKNKKESVSDSPVSDDPFERKHNEFLVNVWPKFPRQLNQDATYDAYYNALLEGATKQEIIAGIEKYAEWVKLNGVQQSYIKGSQKYMEERRWTDNYDLTAPQDSMTGKPRTKGDWVDD